MNDSTTNNSQSADNSTAGAEVTALAPELGPNGIPINPPEGEAPPTVEHDFIMDTLFGDGNAEPPANSGEGQTKGSNSSDGQSQQGNLAPPAAAPAANGEEGSPQSGSSSTQQQSGQQQGSGEGASTQTPAQGSPASAETQPPPLSVEDRLRLASVDALSQQNQELLARLRAYEQGGQPPQQQGQGQQPQPNQPGGGQEPPLRLVVPDPLFDAMMSDDPATAKQGMSVLITAVAENAVQAAMKRVVPLIDQRMSAVTQALTQGEEVQKMEASYFERFPTHNNELFKPLIQQVVHDKYKTFPHAKWDEVMMDAVGATVNEKLKAIGIDPSNANGGQQQTGQNGQGQTNGNGNGQPPARQKPAPMLDGGTRSGGGVPDNASDFITSTFG